MTLPPANLRRRALLMVLIAVFVLTLVSVGTYRTLVVPQGKAFDFYTLWYGGRVFWSGDNPYSLDTARDIQLAVFGELRPESANQQGYAYPAYAAVLLAPFLALPFPVAAAVWSALSLLGVAVASILTARALDWMPRPIDLLFLLLGIFFFRYALIVVVIGQVQVAVWLGLALSLFLYHRHQDRWAGLVLVIAALRPEFGLPLGLLISLLSLRAGRKQLVLAWLGGLAAVGLIALFRRPTWPLDFWDGLRLYSGYAPVLWPPGLYGIWGWLAAGLVLGMAAFQLVTNDDAILEDPVYAAAILIPILLIGLPQTGSYTLTWALIPWLVAIAPPANLWARVAAVLMLVAPWGIWLMSQSAPQIMPSEHLVIPALAMLALTLSRSTGKDTLRRAAGVQ